MKPLWFILVLSISGSEHRAPPSHVTGADSLILPVSVLNFTNSSPSANSQPGSPIDGVRNAVTAISATNTANPAAATFAVSSLEINDHWRVAFTNAAGTTHIEPAGSLANGPLTYLITNSDPTNDVANGNPVLDDGSANAPAGFPQHPKLLSGYAARPPWMVAGVDYAVGVPSGTVLKNPQTINDLKIGVDTGRHLIWVNGDNLALSGYDFTGWQVYIQGGHRNIVIKDSFFGSRGGVYADPSSENVTIRHCEFNDLGDIASSSLITLSGTGSKIVEYNWLHNSPQHFLELNNGGNVNYSFNLIENGARSPGAHLNVIQFQGGDSNATYVKPVISYNTIIQTPQSSGGELIQLYNPVHGITNGLVSNNTMLAIPGPRKAASVSYMINAANSATTGVIRDNYMYAAGAFGFFYPNTPTGVTISNNVNMATGTIIQFR